MPKTKKFIFEKPITVIADEDDATLAAVDQGISDGKFGRTVSSKKVRKLLRTWLADSPLLNALTVLGLTSEQMLATLPQARQRVFARHYGKRTQSAKSSARRQREK